VCELDAAGNPVAGVVFGANGLLVYGTSGYQFDPQGNATHLMDDDGLVLGHLAYDAWGQRMSGNNPTPYGYKGQWGYYTDAETGLLLLTHRYLDPATGRFLTRDPIGFEGGINLYAYVGNGVINNIDPDGLWCIHLGGGRCVGTTCRGDPRCKPRKPRPKPVPGPPVAPSPPSTQPKPVPGNPPWWSIPPYFVPEPSGTLIGGIDPAAAAHVVCTTITKKLQADYNQYCIPPRPGLEQWCDDLYDKAYVQWPAFCQGFIE